MTPGRDGGDSCGGHAGVGEELRALVLTALDRIGPVLDRLRTENLSATTGPAGSAAGSSGVPCAVCPVCAVIAALRGERPELATRLAEQAAGLLTVLRAALEDGAAPAREQGPAPEQASPPPGRRVQRIHVERAAP